MMHDLLIALRSLWRVKAFSAAAAVTLAIGVCGTTVMFALIEGVLLRPLPVREQDRLIIAWKEVRFRAAVAEWSGDVRGATRDYEAAITAVPGSVTPMLALGRLADEHDRSAEARQRVERALTSTTGVLDPWRRYLHGQAWQAADRIATLRTWQPK
jgi:hypothetical protein